jgi:hypothetical protein
VLGNNVGFDSVLLVALAVFGSSDRSCFLLVMLRCCLDASVTLIVVASIPFFDLVVRHFGLMLLDAFSLSSLVALLDIPVC